MPNQNRTKAQKLEAVILLLFCTSALLLLPNIAYTYTAKAYPIPTTASKKPTNADEKAFFHLHTHMKSSFLDFIMPGVSEEGVLGGIVLGIYFLGDKPTKEETFLAGLAVASSEIIVSAIKKTAARPRPYMKLRGIRKLDPTKDDFESFPSGHAAFVFACATLYSLEHPGKAWFFIPAACLVALSRIYLGVHYPSDILIGATLGGTSAFLVELYKEKILNLSLLPEIGYFNPLKENAPALIVHWRF